MADKKFSELETASEIKNSDFMALSQDTGNGKVSLKATILAIATKMLTAINFTSALQTEDKTVLGAINEVAQGGGGGGTGGHTIIDENGNSMSARAGLQFVGGANVSDDSTNNKTIVDIASAGGIDGVFVDTDNLISSGTLSNSGTTSYTATEDCYFVGYSSSGSDLAYLIDNVTMIFAPTNQTHSLLLKKGQTLTVGEASTYSISYKIYGIQTGTTHSKFQPVIYSTEEREIGVWIDGKPLYVRTYNVTFSSNYTDVTIDTTHEVKLFDGGVDSNANDNFIHLGYGTSQNDMCGAYEYEAGKIRFQNFYYSSRPNGWLNVYYTKSTDVAGSGTWTPQGVPTVHYSTDEQIVGTYLGDTLYQKTYRYTSGFASGNNTLNFDIDVASVIRDCKVVMQTPDTNPVAIIGYGNSDFHLVNVNSERAVVYSSSGNVPYIDYVDITIQYTKSS